MPCVSHLLSSCRNSVVGCTGVCRSPGLEQGRSGAGSIRCGDARRRASLRLPALRSARDGRRRDAVAGFGAWRLARVQGRRRRCDGDGRSCPDRGRDQPGDVEAAGRRRGGDGRAQSPAPCAACHVLHACRWTRRRDEPGHDTARCARGQPHAACGAGASASAKPDLDAEQIEQVLGRKGNAVGGVLQFGIPRGDAIVDSGHAGAASHGHWPPRSISSRPAAARRRSQATSCWRRRRWNLCWPHCAMRASR